MWALALLHQRAQDQATRALTCAAMEGRKPASAPAARPELLDVVRTIAGGRPRLRRRVRAIAGRCRALLCMRVVALLEVSSRPRCCQLGAALDCLSEARCVARDHCDLDCLLGEALDVAQLQRLLG